MVFARACLLMLMLSSTAFTAEPALTFPELFDTLSLEVETPHIPWAKPLAGRKLRALVIGHRWGQRETVELMQRLDIDCVPVLVYQRDALFSTTSHWGHEKVASIKQAAVLKDFKQKLEDAYDVIIMGLPAAADFPPEVVTALIAKIRGGTGLVFFWPGDEPRELMYELGAMERPPDGPAVATISEDDDLLGDGLDLQDPQDEILASMQALTTGVPFEALPGLRVEDRDQHLSEIISLHKCGEGRAALVRYRTGGHSGPILTPADDSDLNYEYYQSFVIKTILWAARCEPDVMFEQFPPSVSGEKGVLSFALRNNGEPVDITLSVSIRSPQLLHRLPAKPWAAPGVQQTVSLLEPVSAEQTTMRLSAGAKDVSIPLPRLPAGEYFVDVEIASDEGKLNWATTVLSVAAPCEIAAVEIEPGAIDLAREDTPEVRVSVWLDKAAPEDATINLAVLDNHHRILARQTLALEKGKQSAEGVFALCDIDTTLLKVRAELTDGQRVRSIMTGYLTAFNRPWDDFTFFAWGGGGRDYVARQRYRCLAGLGVDAVRGGVSAESLQVADIRQVSDLIRFSGTVDKETRVVSPCFSSPEFRESLRDAIERGVTTRAVNDCFGYCYGDEFGFASHGGLPAACCSESCTLRLRKYLAGQYGAIDDLNRQRGSDYTSFDDIVPSRESKDIRDSARRTGNYSALLDQWLYNYYIFSDTMRFGHDTLKALDSRPRIGVSTPLWNWYYRAYDWAAIMPHCDFATPYGPWGDSSNCESIRSFAGPGTILSAHYGSYVTPSLHDEDHFRMVPYAILMRGGANAFWYTTWGNEGGISPWLDPYPCLARSSEEILSIKRGLGKLLLGAQRQDDRIAIHYSTPSILFSFLVSGPHVPWRINALIEVLQSLGFQADLVSSKQIVSGELEQYRALLMPTSQCIGGPEGEQIEAFVRAGGLLIADIRPGIADGHGRLKGETISSALFGLKWDLFDPEGEKPVKPMGKVKAQLTGDYKGKSFSGPLHDELSVDAGCSLAGAESIVDAEATPLVIVNTVGKGVAICLNTLFDGKQYLLRSLLAAHGINPLVDIEDRQEGYSPGTWLAGAEFTRFADGAAQYVGMTRKRTFSETDEQSGRLNVKIEAPAHVYDMRDGSYLGKKDTVAVALPASGMKLLSVLPYPVEGLRVSCDQEGLRSGGAVTGTVALDTGGSVPVRHVVHLAVTRPDGKEVRYLARNLETVNGAADFRVPLALNEPTGTYGLMFTDVATKVAQKVQVEVK